MTSLFDQLNASTQSSSSSSSESTYVPKRRKKSKHYSNSSSSKRVSSTSPVRKKTKEEINEELMAIKRGWAREAARKASMTAPERARELKELRDLRPQIPEEKPVTHIITMYQPAPTARPYAYEPSGTSKAWVAPTKKEVLIDLGWKLFESAIAAIGMALAEFFLHRRFHSGPGAGRR